MEKLWSREDEKELEALVQLGLQTGQVEECHTVYLSNNSPDNSKIKACMVGTAMVGKFGDKDLAYSEYMNAVRSVRPFALNESDYIERFSKMLNINGNLLLRASYKHMSGVTIDHQLDQLRQNCFN